MNQAIPLDCIIIGYNETPFEEYEGLLRSYGVESEAYRDLKFNFVDIEGKKLNYVDLLNMAYNKERKGIELETPGVFISGDIPNLAAVYLTNFLRKKGFEATYVNLFQYQRDKLVEYLSRDPLCVAITTTFYVVSLPVVEMIKFIRQHNTKTKIIIGGPLVSNYCRQYHGANLTAALDDIDADIYVVESQGELTLAKIVAALKSGSDISSIPNIIYNDPKSILSKFTITNTERENNNLDDNVLDWSSFKEENLGATIQTRTARSCAFSCSFCGYPARAGKLTLASVETIERELDSIINLGNVKNVVFIDDTFNVPLDRFKNICRLMINKNYNLSWFSYFRCSNSDEEAIELMGRSGCKGVFLGIESGSPEVLKSMHKAATVDKYRTGIKLLRQYGITTFASFITGFPTENEDTVQETVDFIKETKPDFYRTMLWYCEPGTPIHAKRDEYGIVGEGFKWRHSTMDSLEALDHIDNIFLTIKETDSIWLPQWSFDFWFIPYILGKGISIEQFKEFMRWANKMLALEISVVPRQQKSLMQQRYLQAMISSTKQWADVL